MTDKQKKTFTILAIIIFILISVFLTWAVGKPLIQNISEPERFREWVDSQGAWGRIAFVGVVIFQVIIAFIPGEPMEIGAGYAFGAVEGTILCMLGILLGSVIVFAFVHRYGVKAVELFFSKEKIESIAFLRDARKLNMLVFIVFLIPGTPKDMLTYVVGLTPMKLKTWIWISTLARIPSIISSTIGGDQLGSGNHMNAVIVFVITALVSVVGILIYNKMTARGQAPSNGDNAR